MSVVILSLRHRFSHPCQILPQEFGISIDLAYPTKHVSETRLSRNQSDLNTFVDSVLRTIYQVSAPSEVLTRRRRVVFTSFSSDVCAFLNWKQPNCEMLSQSLSSHFSSLTASDPVFYASSCGKDAESVGAGDDDDRAASLGVAVEIASSNNLLGVFVDAALLVSPDGRPDRIIHACSRSRRRLGQGSFTHSRDT